MVGASRVDGSHAEDREAADKKRPPGTAIHSSSAQPNWQTVHCVTMLVNVRACWGGPPFCLISFLLFLLGREESDCRLV